MSNKYSAPNASLVETSESGGSLDAALAGEYEVGIADILSEAWQKTKGIKRYVLGAGLLMYLVMFVVIFVISFATVMLTGTDPESTGPMAVLVQLVLQVVMMAVVLPFSAGIFIMCLKQVQGQQPEFGDLFSCFNKTGTLLLSMILMYIMIFIGYLLFILPGIYLTFAYVMAIPLIVDRDLGPWEALETSRKAITKHWFAVFGFMILMSLIMFVSMIPLLLGLIWTIPMMAVAMALLYRNIFGITRF
ncbi:MAG: hypothetical protein CML06_07460 [Pseudomonadales bacterium]|nr:hypothetical protein [Pseudomonadales bacterium]